MSLDIYLTCPCCESTLHTANLTHNLGDMAKAAKIYLHLWHPERHKITKAKQLIKPLTIGLNKLKENQLYYKAYNPPNGWGSYENLVIFIEYYLAACIKHPKALISVSI